MHKLGPRGTPTLPHYSTDGIPPSGHDIKVLRQAKNQAGLVATSPLMALLGP